MMRQLLDYPDVWLMGGGGKTTLMYQLAAAWRARNETVIATTTTQIRPPTPDQCLDLRVGDLPQLVAGLVHRPAPLATLARRIRDGKCLGFSADDVLSLRPAADRLVVEADGAAGLPVKAHAPHEPVVAASATCVVAVVGAWCIGVPLSAAHVHRPQRFAELSGRPLLSPIGCVDVANVILHDQGWLRCVPDAAAFHVVITGGGERLAEALRGHPFAHRLSGIWCS
jgi:probable selenium-dependent hydroxylase accessory protein YqeC